MKKILYVLFDLLTLAFLAGAYVFQYFVKRKLGMVRWLNYNNMKLQESMPLERWKTITVVIVVLLAGLVIAGCVKNRRKLGKIDWIMQGLMFLLVVAYAGFTLLKNVESFNSYYFIMPLLGMAALMQVLRNGTAWIFMQQKRS